MLILRSTFGSSRASTADILSQQRLRSSTTDSLLVPAATLSTVGRRAFPVAVACTCIWIMERFTFPHYLLAVSADTFKQRLTIH